MKNKKADITLTTIIIAIIVILVLVVLVVIFSKGMGVFTSGAVSCKETRGGDCAADCNSLGDYCKDGCARIGGTDCKKLVEGSVCCVPIIKKEQ